MSTQVEFFQPFYPGFPRCPLRFYTAPNAFAR